ncbi:MAG: HAD family hydrolase [Betaproteobacteria bacterium]
MGLVIFDCDGVLVDSEPLANRVLHELLASLGLRMPLEEVMRSYIGRTRQGCVALTEEKLGRPVPATFVADWNALLFETFRRELQPVRGVKDLIGRLAGPFCVASNSSADRVRVALGATGLLERFEGRVFTADEVARPKPAPDLFLYAARTMGFQPAHCTVVEDSATGVRAAMDAGMTVLAYAGAGHADPVALAAAGAEVFDSMDAIAERLRT